MAVFTFKNCQKGAVHFLLPDRPILVGSDERCGIRIDGPGVAAIHAEVRPARGRWQIAVVAAGLILEAGGLETEQFMLEEGVPIEIGEARLFFRKKTPADSDAKVVDLSHNRSESSCRLYLTPSAQKQKIYVPEEAADDTVGPPVDHPLLMELERELAR